MKLVDIGVSKSPAGNSVRVQVPPAAPTKRELQAYIIGVSLGDGNLSCPNGRAARLRITCDIAYPLVGKEIKSALHVLFPKNKVSYVRRSDNCFDISIYSNKLNDLLPWKLGRGTKIEQHAHVPDWILREKKYSLACLRGLIQTDGYVYTDRGYKMMQFVSCTEELSQDVFTIISDLGYAPRMYKIPTRTLFKYVVRLSKNTNDFLCETKISKR